jgi:hypothetical protein
MASQEDLRKIYPSRITPGIFGNHFNERPRPDAFGRTPATPLEVERAINGEFNQPLPQSNAITSGLPKEKTPSEWQMLKQARERRKREERLRRNKGNGRGFG